jgi:NAD(P)H-flavin reductase
MARGSEVPSEFVDWTLFSTFLPNLSFENGETLRQHEFCEASDSTLMLEHDTSTATAPVREEDALNPAIQRYSVRVSTIRKPLPAILTTQRYQQVRSTLQLIDSLEREPTTPQNNQRSLLEPNSNGQEKSQTRLPNKRYGRIFRNLRWTIFSVYRRLCVLIVCGNIIAMVVLGSTGRLFKLPDAVPHLSTAISINLVVAVLMRQEYVINALFKIFRWLPHSLPLKVRLVAAEIYHYGGIHSGAGISALFWFLLFNQAVAELCSSGNIPLSYKIGILFFLSTVDVLLTLIIVFAEPTLRAKIHNVWEMTHRFAGWAAITSFWVLFGLLAKVQSQQEKTSVGHIFIHALTFWCLIIITVSLVLPWLRLRRVPLEAVQLSDHAVRLRFQYAAFPAGAAQKLSYDGIREFHPFAGISDLDDGTREFSMIVSKAGDWTKRTISNPPTKLWKRGIPTYGVISLATLFTRVVFVATGSGIGPVLSVLKHRDKFSCRIIWSTRDPEETYQQEIINYVHEADPGAIIFNTSGEDSPDLIGEAYTLYIEHDAEAVFLISNPKVTRKVVYGLETRGVPIFGVIFDS